MQTINPAEALQILHTPDSEIYSLLHRCRETGAARFSDGISICSIINAKSGNCTEDCTFCAQSSVSSAIHESYPMIDVAGISAARNRAGESGADHFSIVMSGRSPAEKELLAVCGIITGEKNGLPHWCASLGILSMHQMKLLKDAGLRRYHHNLETDRTYFPQICSTHEWTDRFNTVRNARLAGLEVCSGGIIGLGESLDQRVAMAFSLRDLRVDSIALNFLIPLEGTGIDYPQRSSSPADLLRTVIMFGLVCQDSELRICAGRKKLEGYEKEIFSAGVTGIMTGDLLTTAGSGIKADLELLEAAGRVPAS